MTRTINTPNGPVSYAIEGGVLALSGPTGTHRVTVDKRTNVEAHVAGFVAANGGAALSAPLLIGTTASGSDWIAYPDRHTTADVATMVDRIGKFGGTPSAAALALLGRAPVVTYGKIGTKRCTNPIHEMDEYDRARAYKEPRFYESQQPVYVNGELIGHIVRGYSQKRVSGQIHPIELGSYCLIETNPDYYHVTEDSMIVYSRKGRKELAYIKARIAETAAAVA